MPAIKIPNRQLIQLVNELDRLMSYLMPGVVSYRFGQLKGAAEPPAARLIQEETRLRQEFVKKDEAGKPIPASAQVNGQTITGFELTDPEAFTTRMSALMDAETEVTFPLLLDFQLHIKNIKAEMLPKEKLPAEMRGIDWSLIQLVVKDTAAEVGKE